MLKKIARAVALGVVAVAVLGAVLYAAGLRIVLYGGGTPHLEFVSSAERRAAELARHREAQRALAPIAPVAPAAPAVDPEPSAGLPPAPAAPGVAAAAPPRSPGSAYWTDFRGPDRSGGYRQRPILAAWPAAGPRLLWKQPIGGGYASFVIARGRAFTIEQRGSQEVVAAYDVSTGRELWTNGWTATFSESMGGEGPRATPTWFDGRIYALGGAGELRCLDEAAGQTVWRTNILQDADASNLQWGVAGSPLIVDDTVVVLPGGSGQSVVAYRRGDGRRAWSALDDRQAYSSPMLVTLAGIRQILVFSAERLVGLTPDRGELLWEFPWKTDYGVNASQPLVVSANRVFVSTGYGAGAALIELTPAARGLTAREVWRTNRMKNQFTSSLLHEGYIYGLDESILACIDAATGELKWKGGRYGYGQVMLAGGNLIVLTESGELALVKAAPERHQELLRIPAIEGKTWNHPAISDGYLLVRNATEMAAFDLRAEGPPNR